MPHTVAGKNACLMLLCGIIMLSFVMFLPSLFYKLTKEQLTDWIGNSIQECSVRIGFLLTNHRPTGQLSQNEEYIALLEEYYQEGADQEKLRAEIEKQLTNYEEGKMEWDKGTIGNTSYYFMVTDQGDVFCQEDTARLAELIIDSEWFRQNETSEEKKWTRYSPVLTFNFDGEENQYFCYQREFSIGEVTSSMIHVALFQDYIAQLEQMKNADIQDFMLVCGTEILYQHLSDSSIEYTSLSDYTLGDYQYGVLKEERDDGFVFTALCSLNREGLYLIVKMSKEEIMTPFLSFFRIMQICVIGIILIMVILSCGIVFFSLRRLTVLGREMVMVGARRKLVFRITM